MRLAQEALPAVVADAEAKRIAWRANPLSLVALLTYASAAATQATLHDYYGDLALEAFARHVELESNPS